LDWSGEYIHIRTWSSPWRNTADTHPLQQLLVGCQHSPTEKFAINATIVSHDCPIGDDTRSIIEKSGLPACRLTGRKQQSEWVRDYGYMFKGSETEQVPITYGEFHEGYKEDVKSRVSHPWDLLDVLHEGGNLLATGTGICLSTMKHLTHYHKGSKTCLKPLAGRPLDDEALREKVSDGMVKLGCQTWIFVEAPVRETTGHIDVFVGQVEDTTFVVGKGNFGEDWFDTLTLGSAYERLSRLGRSFDFMVEELPMPPLLEAAESDDLAAFENNDIKKYGPNCWLLGDGAVGLKCAGQADDCCTHGIRHLWRSYTNFLPVKREGKPSRIIIPSFKEASGVMGEYANKTEVEEVAPILGKYFDELLWVDQVERVQEGGSVHCMTRGVPTNVPNDMLPCGVLEE